MDESQAYRRWKMIRISAETHRRFSALHARREAGRGRGQVVSNSDRITQDEVLRYLLSHEEATQQRRRRARRRLQRRRCDEATPTPPSSLGGDSDAALYTPSRDQSPHPMKG